MKRFLKLGFEENLVQKLTLITDQGTNIVKVLQNYKRLNCTVHIINTILRHTFNEEILEKNASKIQKVQERSKVLVTFLKQSGLLSNLKHTIRQEVETRLNSKLPMLNLILG